MTDTRCVRSEYQLDVDTMVIEYAIHHAITASFKSLHAESSAIGDDHSNNNEDELDLKSTAGRLVETFDLLLRLFKYNHPTASHNEGTIFNIKILEFLVLLSQWMQKENRPVQLNRERKFNAHIRREWLRQWTATDQGLAMDLDSPEHAELESSQIELNDVLLPFLDLSAEIGGAMGFVNEQWYELAAQFMMQCVLERIGHLYNRRDHEMFRLLSSEVTMSWLSECFAWGIVEPCPIGICGRTSSDQWIQQRLAEQRFIRNVFRPISDQQAADSRHHADSDTFMTENDDTTASALTENPVWTNIRSKYYSAFSEMIGAYRKSARDDDEAYRHISVAVERKHPRRKFLLALLDFIEGCWCLNVDSLNSKPVLVQIEEGKIKGMDEDSFQAFIKKVGLKIHQRNDGRPTVRWAL